MANTVKGIKVNGTMCDFAFNEVSGNTKVSLVSPNNTTFQVMVDDNGGVYGYNPSVTGDTGTTATTLNVTSPDGTVYELRSDNDGNIYGYNESVSPITPPSTSTTVSSITTQWSKLYINSFYCGGDNDEHTIGYCSHNFVELSNLTNNDINLSGMSIQYAQEGAWSDVLPLKGVIKSKSTFLIRGAQSSVIDSNQTKIKVSDYDMEWKTVTGELIKFNSTSAKFYLTFQTTQFSASTPYVSAIVPASYIDLVGVGTTDACESATTRTYTTNNDLSKCLFKKYYSMDGVKQATKDLNKRNNLSDWNYVDLTKNDGDLIPSIEDYTPKASKDKKDIYFNKTKLVDGKPSVITCSFGIEATDNGVGATRCFNWVSKGVYDEYIWIKTHSSEDWGTANESYKSETGISANYNRQYVEYGDGIVFTSHKFIKKGLSKGIYDYIAGHKNSDGTPDLDKCTDIRSFTVRSKEDVSGETIFVQTTDQQGFNWEEYRLWNYVCNTIVNEDNTPEITTDGSDITNVIVSSNVGKLFKLTSTVYSYSDESGNLIYTTEKPSVSTYSTYVAGKYIVTKAGSFSKLGTNNNGIQFMVNTGDMTQNGNRIGEWLDYFNGKNEGISNLEENATVGNNDLSPKNTYQLGDGEDSTKLSLSNYSYFYCNEIDEDNPSVFDINGTSYYIPSLYSYNYGITHFLCFNSEIKEAAETGVYGFETFGNFYPLMQEWCEKDMELNSGYTWNIAYCHEMPFTILTSAVTSDSKYKTLDETTGRNGINGMNANINVPNKDAQYWFSEFCQTHNIKLVMGGHKHTQSTSYGILENVSYSVAESTSSANTTYYTKVDGKESLYKRATDTSDTSKTYYTRKYVSFKPIIVVPTDASLWSESNSYYIKDGDTYTKVSITRKDLYTGTEYYTDESGTKFVDEIFNDFMSNFDSAYLSLSTVFDGKYYPNACTEKTTYLSEFLLDFEINSDVTPVIYAMSQASGYKHTSNKELPTEDIPWLNHYYATNGSSATSGQKYPFYTIWTITPDSIEGNVRKVEGAFNSGKFDINKEGRYTVKGKSANGSGEILYSINGLDDASKNTFNTIIIK